MSVNTIMNGIKEKNQPIFTADGKQDLKACGFNEAQIARCKSLLDMNKNLEMKEQLSSTRESRQTPTRQTGSREM